MQPTQEQLKECNEKTIKIHARMHECTHACAHARTHACTHTTVYGSLDFVLDNLGELEPKIIHPLTPILIINHPLSASSIYCDPWHSPVQFMCLTVFLHNLCPSFL